MCGVVVQKDCTYKVLGKPKRTDRQKASWGVEGSDEAVKDHLDTRAGCGHIHEEPVSPSS